MYERKDGHKKRIGAALCFATYMTRMACVRSMSPSLNTSIKVAMKPLVMLRGSPQDKANSVRGESPKLPPPLSCGRQFRQRR